MNFDLISATELTAAAATAFAALALTMARTPAARLRLAVALAAWFAVVVALGASRALSPDVGIGTPGLGLAVALPVPGDYRSYPGNRDWARRTPERTVGVTAPFVAWSAARDPVTSRMVVLGRNVLGFLDLLNAIALGITSTPGALRLFAGEPSSAMMTDYPWLLIPGFLVPLLLSTHLAVFARLADATSSRERAVT